MKVLIITDGNEEIQSIAHLINKSLPDFKIKICSAEDFEGKEILPVDVFFIGCVLPSPSCFNFFELMLSHINLAPRKCGLFSINSESIKYLQSIVKDCEADIGTPLLTSKITNSKGEIKEAELKKWLNSILKI